MEKLMKEYIEKYKQCKSDGETISFLSKKYGYSKETICCMYESYFYNNILK